MSTMLKDQLERDRIRTDFDHNINVNAGAGTGKTCEMVERISNGIIYGKLSLKDMAVITFTKKAAAEMRTRIIEKLKDNIKDKSDDATVNRCKEELKLINVAQISTVHSFCQTILKERPIEAGVDPFFEVIEDNSELLLKTLDIFIDKHMNNNDGSETAIIIKDIITELLVELSYSIYSSDYGYGTDKSLQGLFEIFIRYRDLELALPEKINPTLMLNKIYDLINKTKTIFETEPKLIDYLYKIESEIKNININELDVIDKLKDIDFNYGYTKIKTFKDEKASFKSKLVELRHNLIDQIKYNHNYPILKSRMDKMKVLFKEFQKLYRTEMIKESNIDFIGLLMSTVRLLKNNKDIRTYFKNKYKRIFVDEFQDTDPLQAEIISFLCEKDGQFESDWKKIELKPGKLFIVGDPKQSIYKFNRVNMEIYNEMTSKISDADTVPLTTNFRSKSQIIDFVNSFSGSEIKKKSAKHIEYIDLKTHKDKIIPQNDIRIIEVQSEKYILRDRNGDKEYNKVDSVREDEAKLTAAWLKENKNKLKDITKWSQITVLFRKYKILPLLQEAFESLEIPYIVAGGKSYFDRYEINALLSFLKAIADPTDNIAIMAALKGPFFGYSDKEIWEWKTSDDENRSFNYLNPNIEDKTDIDKSLLIIKDYYFKSFNVKPVEILLDILNNSSLTAGIIAGYQGYERLQNLFKAIEYINEQDTDNFRDVIEAFEFAIDNNLEMGDLNLQAQTEDAVQLMSIHKAKGLENDVIYLADATAGNDSKERLIPYQGKLYFKDENFATYSFKNIQKIDDDENIEEAKRLRYVAITRAKEYFVVNKYYNHKAGSSFVGKMYKFLSDYNYINHDIINIDLVDYKTLEKSNREIIQPVENDEIKSEKDLWQQNLHNNIETAKKVTFIKKNPSLYKEKVPDITVPLKLDVSENDYTPFNITVDRSDHLGSLVHRLLELSEDIPDDKFNNVINSLKEEFEIEIENEKIIEIYNSIVNHPVYKRTKTAKKVFRELPIKFTDNDIIYDGVIDLLFQDEKGWVLADYKIITHETKEEREKKKAKYQSQLDIYAKGLKKCGIEVTEKLLLLPENKS